MFLPARPGAGPARITITSVGLIDGLQFCALCFVGFLVAVAVACGPTGERGGRHGL